MVTKTERIASNVLWFITVLITFLLLFEKHLVLPAWIQSLGRMHPVLLHFPIVLVLAGISSEFYRPTDSPDVYSKIRRLIWLSAALSSAFTVLMGIFLSQEEGYGGSTLLWHKWTGIATFYLATLFYFFHNQPLFNQRKKILVVPAGILLVVSGHFGSELTHGEGFITQPLQNSGDQRVQVPFEQALVFDHLVLPILEAKCASCHNERKSKGDLILTDSSYFVRGGKTGPLIEAYQPSLSLLIQRIHLPVEDKKHMPPKGKPQLTPVEESILAAWINTGTPFRTRVATISAQDSLSILARQHLSTQSAAESPTYTFRAAKPETIESLNNEYRSVSPIAVNSPALSVELYGSQAYTSKSLEELAPVKAQIVDLNVSRMPVTDQDLKIISTFENLRRLNLNFTEVTSQGLSHLGELRNMQTLHLAGTAADEPGIAAFLPKSGSLRHLTLWESGVGNEAIITLRNQYPAIEFMGEINSNDTTRLKLNKPLAKSEAWVFEKKSKIDLYHPVRETHLHYTLDGTDPDSLSPFSRGPVDVDKTTIVRVKGYKDGWLPSDIAEFQIFRNTFKPDSVFLLNRLNRVHLAEGAHTFFDKQLGQIGANNPAWANHFAGVRDDDLQLLCWFNDPIHLETVGIRIMVEEETGIYPPGIIEIWGGENENQLRLLTKNVSPNLPEPREKPTLQKIELSVGNQPPVKCLKIVAKPYQKPGERPKLILIDEMFLN